MFTTRENPVSPMEFLKGQALSGGMAKGTAVIYEYEAQLQSPASHPHRRDSIHLAHVSFECERMDMALAKSNQELCSLALNAAGPLAECAARALLIAQASMASEIAASAKERIAADLINVEDALDFVISQWINRLSALENEYLRERIVDVHDVGRRLIRHLLCYAATVPQDLSVETIIVTSELVPTDAILLANAGVAGIVTEIGSKFGHAAIIARALGIPAVTGITNVTKRIGVNATVLVDGDSGKVVVAPTATELMRFNASLLLKSCEDKVGTRVVDAEPCSTTDGIVITLRGNAGLQGDVDQVQRLGLDGVGLLRTEFLYLRSLVRPGPEAQRIIYTKIAERLSGRPLFIRTFDLGGDKLPSFLALDPQIAPENLSLRGLAFSLAELSLLQDQLKAILQVAQVADLRILFPMVISGADLARAIAVVDELLKGTDRSMSPPIGAMIETPAALFCLEEILEMVDFLAIGTNDLTHYMLATRRELAGTNPEVTAMHPAVLRAIDKITRAARLHDCPVCVCGEEAGEAEFAELLIGLGIRELSISPPRAKTIRAAIAKIDSKAATGLAARALNCRSPQEVRDLFSSPNMPAPQAEESTLSARPGAKVCKN